MMYLKLHFYKFLQKVQNVTIMNIINLLVSSSFIFWCGLSKILSVQTVLWVEVSSSVMVVLPV